MLALTLAAARNAALTVALIALVMAIASAWLIKAIVSKLLTAAVLVGLAVAVWSQRTSLDACADDVRENLVAGATEETSCTFFGRDVTVPAPRGGPDAG